MTPLIEGAGAGVTGTGLQINDNDAQMIVRADTWDTGSITIQTRANGNWINIPGMTFTADEERLYQGHAGQYLRAVTSAGSLMAGAAVYVGQRLASDS